MAFEPSGNPIIQAFDTMAQIGIADPSVHFDNEKIMYEDNVVVQGVGGTVTKAGVCYQTQLHLRVGLPLVNFQYRKAKISTPGLSILWDFKQMRNILGIIFDTNRFCVKAERLGAVIQLDPIALIAIRLKQIPIIYATVCGGIISDVVALLEMGIRLQKVIYVDHDEDAAEVASAICEMVNVPFVRFTDVRSVRGSDIGFVHAATFTPVCGAWSTLNPESKGFGSENSYSFVECGRLRLELTQINPQLRSMFETNIPPQRLMHDRERQQQLAGGEFKKLEASFYKSPSRRPRAFAPVNIVIRLHSEFDCGSAIVPWYINENAVPESMPTKCAVSKYFTKSAIYFTDYKTNSPRRATPDETDSLQGLCPTHSQGFGKCNHDYLTRIRLTGQCLNHFHCRIVFRYLNLNLSEMVPKSVSSTNYEIDMPDPDKLELELRNMSSTALEQYVRQRMQGYPNDDLRIRMKNPDGLAYHTKYIPEVPKNSKNLPKKR